jgi:predicted PurR-regulated permease PerM
MTVTAADHTNARAAPSARRTERFEFTGSSVLRAVAIMAAVGVGVAFLIAISTVVWWIVIAAVLGAFLYPACAVLKRHVHAPTAFLIIIVVVIAAGGWLGFRGLSEIKDQAESVRSSATATAQQLEASPDYGSVAKQLDLTDKVNTVVSAVPGSSSGAEAPIAFLGSAGGALFSVALLSLLFVIFWPQLLTGALDQVADIVHRDVLAAHLRRSFRRCASYAWLMLARAIVVGLVAAGISLLLGFGSPTLVGLWFALWSLVPAIGLVFAAIPLAVVATIHSPAEGIVVLVAVIAAQALDAVVVQRWIEARSVRIGPAMSMLAVLLGGELYGVGGAIVFLAAAAFGLALLHSLTDYRRDLVESVKRLGDADDSVPQPSLGRPERSPDDTITWWYELGWRSPLLAAVVAVGIAAVIAVTLAGPVVALVATAVLLSFAFDPIIGRLQRWLHLPRGFAVAVLCGVLTVTLVGATAWFAPSTIEQAGTVRQDLPKAVDDLTQLPVLGPVLADNHAPQRIHEWADQLPADVARDPSGITAAASTGGSALLAILIIAFLLVGLLIDGPHLVDALTVATPRRRVATLSRAGGLLANTAGRYFSGSLVLAGLQAVQVLVTGLVLGVPLTPVLAIWAGVWTLVPQVGGAIGGLPFILLAFSHGATTGLIAAAAFGLYLVIANNVLLPVIVGRAVNVSPLATMAATIAGFTLLGVIGAVLAVPIFGAAKSIYVELRPSRAEDPPPGPTRHPSGRVRTTLDHVRDRAAGPVVLRPQSAMESEPVRSG